MKKSVLLNIFALFAVALGANTPFAQKSAPAKSSSKTAASQSSQTAITVTQINLEGLKALVKKAADAKQPLLINFWATWCDPCREEFPELVKIDAEYRAKGLEFVTVSLDNLAEIKRDVPNFLGEMKASMPAYLLKTPEEDAAIAFIAPDYRGGLPMTVLYDANGKLAYSKMGIVKPEVLKPEIEKVLVSDKKENIMKNFRPDPNDLGHGRNEFIQKHPQRILPPNNLPVIHDVTLTIKPAKRKN